MSMIGRMFGALFLKSNTYEEIEHNKSAIWQALFIVVMVSAATVGGELLSGQETGLWWAIVRGVIRGVASWAAWALCTWFIGEIIFDVVETDADWGQLARTTGFAQTPGILNALIFLGPIGDVVNIGSVIYYAAYAWTFACMVVAVRQSLDYTSTLRAVMVILVAFVPVFILNAGVLGLTGGIDFSGSGGGVRSPVIR